MMRRTTAATRCIESRTELKNAVERDRVGGVASGIVRDMKTTPLVTMMCTAVTVT